MASPSKLRFFTTPDHDCSYLNGKKAITLFADPLAHIDKNLYSVLSSVGFRRSGNHIYRPYCQSCSACIPVRVPVRLFKMKRRFKRILKKNIDIMSSTVTPKFCEEYFALYDRYLTARHSDGDMFPASRNQFESFLVEGRDETKFIEFRSSGKLLAIAVFDQLNDGLSAVYSFYDPDESFRGLGVLAVLYLIEETQRQGLKYVYLGYWIKESKKMSYKLDYEPNELYINNQWINSETPFERSITLP